MIGFIAGYIQQDFFVGVQIWGAGMILALLMGVPDWPIYRKNDVIWLKSLPKKSQDGTPNMEGSKSAKSSSNKHGKKHK